MEQITTYILFVVGFVLLVKGADFTVEGASRIAKKLGWSDLFIGLTIVSLGTSAPELVVNIIASYNGSSDIAIGNILGSNIANVFLILGVTSIVAPLIIVRKAIKKELIISIGALFLFLFLANDTLIFGDQSQVISKINGFVFICVFLAFIYFSFRSGKIEKAENNGDISILKSIGLTLVGLVGLVFGGKWIVAGAVLIARNAGMSEAFIGLSIIAIGTSLPELAASVSAAKKGKTDIAIGNVIGSNIFNLLFVIGTSSLIKELPYKGGYGSLREFGSNFDGLICLFSTLLLAAIIFLGKNSRLGKRVGYSFLLLYVFYLYAIFIKG